jgi:hypothetical protein
VTAHAKIKISDWKKFPSNSFLRRIIMLQMAEIKSKLDFLATHLLIHK